MDQSKPVLCAACGKDMVNHRTGCSFIGMALAVRDELTDMSYSHGLQVEAEVTEVAVRISNGLSDADLEGIENRLKD